MVAPSGQGRAHARLSKSRDCGTETLDGEGERVRLARERGLLFPAVFERLLGTQPEQRGNSGAKSDDCKVLKGNAGDLQGTTPRALRC